MMKQFKQIMAWILAIGLMAGISSITLAEEALEPDAGQSLGSALLVIFPNETADENWVSADCLGEVSDGTFKALDPARIMLDGKPVDDELRNQWASQEEYAMEFTTDLLVKGQLVQLCIPGESAFARIVGFDYSYASASGDDYISVMLEMEQELPKASYPIFAIAQDAAYTAPSREMAVEIACGSDGSVTSYIVDIDGDGTEEKIVWDDTASASDEENVFHPLIVSRGDKTLQTLTFFYDGDYTYPDDPQLLDLNGDGVLELILSGTGHNTYVAVYQWQDDAFIETGARYYSGD